MDQSASVMSPLFSVIIPCYNHGAYLRRAIRSIQSIEPIPYEIIIVDDGSSDPGTVSELEQLRQEGFHIIIQANQGPGAARNNGIRVSTGKYIVPLDADDKLRAEYIRRALEVFTANETMDVVYADFELFGARNGINKYADFSLQDLLLANSIGACVIYRKNAWEKVGGYDEQLGKDFGWEDWDLWLNFAAHYFNFQYLNMTGYDYFYHAGSREREFLRNKQKVNHIVTYLEKKYPGLYAPEKIHNNLLYQVRASPLGMIFKIVIAAYFPKYYRQLVAKGKMRKYIF